MRSNENWWVKKMFNSDLYHDGNCTFRVYRSKCNCEALPRLREILNMISQADILGKVSKYIKENDSIDMGELLRLIEELEVKRL